MTEGKVDFLRSTLGWNGPRKWTSEH